MDANLDKIAKDLYGKIQTRFSDIRMGDENANVLSKKEDIPRARFFEFEYEEGAEPLGTIAITLDPQDGIVLQISGDLVNDGTSTTHHGAYKFIRGFRQFAKDRLLNFDVQNIGKSNLDKRDYEFQAKRKEEPIMPAIMENKLYGNNRMSYQDLGEARLIIKHSQPINVDLPAGRTMHIDSIYIENAEGERFKYPFKHINGARALAEHIKHGGNPYDAIGKHITNLSEELASLRKFKGYVSRQDQLSEAMANVTTRVIDRIEEIKETISKLQRTAYYEEFAEAFEEQDAVMVTETIQNDLIDRLTIRTFNEELKAVFPYIYKFVDESELPVVELGVDDLIGEEQEEIQNSQEPAFESPEDQFESFIDDLVREDKDELLSPNPGARDKAVQTVNDLVSQDIEVGPDGTNAIMSLKGLVDDSEFTELLKDLPAETKLNPILQGWLATNHEDVLDKINFPQEGNAEPEVSAEPAQETPPTAEVPPTAEPTEPAAEPTAEMPPEEMPQEPATAPVAESKDDSPPWDEDPKDKQSSFKKAHNPNRKGMDSARALAQKGIAKAIEKAKKAGATLETKLDFGHKEMTLHDAIKECGMEPRDFGFSSPDTEGLSGMLRFISGFYNKEQGNFPLGGERIKIKVKKGFEDGQFGDASEDDLIKVIKFIDAKDPSDEHHHVVRLAGIAKPASQGSMFDTSTLETQLKDCVPTFAPVAESEDAATAIIRLAGLK